jgi:hypothetical protein
MSTQQPSEDELRAMYEEQMRRIRVDDVLMNSVVELINQGMRRTGLAQGVEDERDVAQVHLAIEAVRALMPVAERVATPEQLKPFRDALSQLQLAYVQIGGGAGEAAPPTGESTGGPAGGGGQPGAEPPSDSAPEPKPGEPGPAQRSGRLWVPGQ